MDLNQCSAQSRKRASRASSATLIVIFAAAAAALSLQPGFAHTAATHHSATSRSSRSTRSYRSLMSRGAGFDAPANAPITGEVATVTTDNAPIYAGREQYGQLLSRAQKGTTIVVTGQTDRYYAVAMSNHTTGFIAKTDASLQNIQITTSGANVMDDNGAPADVATQAIGKVSQGLLQSASNYLGVAPYVWGGNTIAGIDCSGFIKAVFAQNGITLPRTAAEQAKMGFSVPLRDVTQWLPGDRMYFECHHSYIDHTGMYIGNGYFIHSSIDHHGVDIDKVANTYYWNHLVAVRRSTELVNASQNSVSVGSADFESDQE